MLCVSNKIHTQDKGLQACLWQRGADLKIEWVSFCFVLRVVTTLDRSGWTLKPHGVGWRNTLTLLNHCECFQ